MGHAIPGAMLDWARREDDTARMRPFFERHDVLLTPVSAGLPSEPANGRGSAPSARSSGWRRPIRSPSSGT